MRRIAAIGALLLWSTIAYAQDRSITVASTTSTEQSGLFGYLLPLFSKAEGIEVKVVAVGTGQALDIGRRGDADVVFVHDRPAEDKFMSEGQGVKRFDVMYNDFIIVGPKSDPAKIAGDKDVADALRRIAAAKAPFISRGDKSGTHAAELRLWKEAGIDIATGKGSWYREIGQGMGPALNMASSSNAYLLSDRGTWLFIQESGRACDPDRGRQAAVQSVRCHAGQSGKASEREGEGRAGLHRLADLAQGAGRDRRLQGQRRAAIFPQRVPLAGRRRSRPPR
ncbi:tungstate transport system substrate-binding protein [Bradyrhizobium sp. GM24.11]